jgi:hypothetical protein
MSAYKYYEDAADRVEKDMTDAGNITVTDNTFTLALPDPKLLNNVTITNPDLDITYAGIDYKYDEGRILEEIRKYINNTYGEHYSRNKFQSTEFIIDCGHGTGFNIGNMMKYTQRYGRKGDAAEWRKDLMKVIHYAIVQLYVHDLENKG